MRRITWRFFAQPPVATGLAILMLVIIGALFAPQLAPYQPTLQDLASRLSPPGSVKSGQAPNYLGTDHLGRDVLSRIIYGARISLIVSFLSVSLAFLIGVFLGLSSGYYGKFVDSFVMRALELQMAFPFVLLALVVLALLGPSLGNLIVLFAISDWPLYARTLRGSVLALKKTDLVEAARAVGMGDARILFKYLLPNCISPLIVIASYEVGRVILTESALGFLGLGVQPPTPTWGTMIADGRNHIRTAWWLITFPGVAMMLTVLAVSFIGDAARDHFDPRLRLDRTGV